MDDDCTVTIQAQVSDSDGDRIIVSFDDGGDEIELTVRGAEKLATASAECAPIVAAAIRKQLLWITDERATRH